MADMVRGLKAGAAAGLVMGIIGGVVDLLLMFTILNAEYLRMYEQVMATMPPEAAMSANTLLMISAVTVVIFAVIFGLIFGAIIGVIYAWLYESIPGKTSIAKGIVVGAVYFVFSIAFSLVMQMAFSGQSQGMEPGSMITGAGYVTGFVNAMIFGYLLGLLWDKFEPKD